MPHATTAVRASKFEKQVNTMWVWLSWEYYFKFVCSVLVQRTKTIILVMWC